jgi:hypothetical protein
MLTSASSHEQAARRAALRQTLENAMDVLDLTESQQQQQQFSSSMTGMPSGWGMGSVNRQNSALSRASLHSSLPSNSGHSNGSSNYEPVGQFQYNASKNNDNNGYSSHSNNALLSSVNAEDRLPAQARSAFIQKQHASESQKQHIIANFLQQTKQHEEQQQYRGFGYGFGSTHGSSESQTTSVLQALMGNMPGSGFPKPYAPAQISKYNMFSSASHHQQQQQQQQQHHQLHHSVQAPNLAPQKNDAAILHALGSHLRDKSRDYVDVSVMPDPEEDIDQRHLRGGVAEPFPEKLHRMLLESKASGRGDIVSFYFHGRGFGIHDPEKFVEEILPEYFKQSKLNSFLRQLNLYGFVRIQSGPDSGGYYHELFLKERPRFSRYMRRVGVPVKGEDRRKSKNAAIQLGPEPDFYDMTAVRRG